MHSFTYFYLGIVILKDLGLSKKLGIPRILLAIIWLENYMGFWAKGSSSKFWDSSGVTSKTQQFFSKTRLPIFALELSQAMLSPWQFCCGMEATNSLWGTWPSGDRDCLDLIASTKEIEKPFPADIAIICVSTYIYIYIYMCVCVCFLVGGYIEPK